MAKLKEMIRSAEWQLRPWWGLIGATLGWSLSQQIGSMLVQDKCGAAGPITLTLINIAGLALAIAGGFVSYRLWTAASGGKDARPFLALVNAMGAGLLSVAIFFQLIAGLTLPRCYG